MIKNGVKTQCPACKDWRYVSKYKIPLPTFTGLCLKCNGRTKENGAIDYKEVRHEGYILIYKPGHTRATNKGYVKRSVLVFEEFLGRNLEHEENIHHINGIKDDDRLSNLQILSNSKHCKLHASKRTLERTLSGKFASKELK